MPNPLNAEQQVYLDKIKAQFPNGLDIPFSQMTLQQKRTFTEIGGVKLSILLGQGVEAVMPVASSREAGFASVENARKAMAGAETVQPGDDAFKKIFDDREVMALEEVKKFFEANPSVKEAAITYGSLHIFKRHQDQYPGFCITTPLEFVRKASDVRHRNGIFDFEYCQADINRICDDTKTLGIQLLQYACLVKSKEQVGEHCLYSLKIPSASIEDTPKEETKIEN